MSTTPTPETRRCPICRGTAGAPWMLVAGELLVERCAHLIHGSAPLLPVPVADRLADLDERIGDPTRDTRVLASIHTEHQLLLLASRPVVSTDERLLPAGHSVRVGRLVDSRVGTRVHGEVVAELGTIVAGSGAIVSVRWDDDGSETEEDVDSLRVAIGQPVDDEAIAGPRPTIDPRNGLPEDELLQGQPCACGRYDARDGHAAGETCPGREDDEPRYSRASPEVAERELVAARERILRLARFTGTTDRIDDLLDGIDAIATDHNVVLPEPADHPDPAVAAADLANRIGGRFVLLSAALDLLAGEGDLTRSLGIVSLGTVSQDRILGLVARAVVTDPNGIRDRFAALLRVASDDHPFGVYLARPKPDGSLREVRDARWQEREDATARRVLAGDPDLRRPLSPSTEPRRSQA